MLAAAPHLRWLQMPTAAPPPEALSPELAASGVVVCNMRGIYDDEIALHTLTLLLSVRSVLGSWVGARRRGTPFLIPCRVPHGF